MSGWVRFDPWHRGVVRAGVRPRRRASCAVGPSAPPLGRLSPAEGCFLSGPIRLWPHSSLAPFVPGPIPFWPRGRVATKQQRPEVSPEARVLGCARLD